MRLRISALENSGENGMRRRHDNGFTGIRIQDAAAFALTPLLALAMRSAESGVRVNPQKTT